LWVGTYWDGLFYHHPERNESRAYGRKATDGKQLSNDAINGIFEDSRKNIWVSTENGLNLIESGKTQVVRYGKKDGFPGNVFYSVLEDEKGKLWMSTTSGLVRFAPETGYIDQYTTENGLLANQFNYNSAYRAENGRMYFGGVKGFVSFAPYDVRFNQQTAPDGLALTGLKINGPGNAEPAGGRLPDYAGDSTASIELAHFQSTFSISYTALDYNTPGLTRYRYQLAGLDDGWVDAGNANTIYFTALPYGDYTLRLKAKTNNSDWGLPTELLDLRITPPWWKSQWAYVLYAVLSGLCLFLLLWSYHRYSREKQRQQLQLFDNEKQKDLYQAKIDFFTNVSHEILTPLTLIKMPIEKLLATAKDGSKVKTNLSVVLRNTTRLVNLVEQLLDFRKTEMDNATLSFVRVDLRELVEDTKERFQSAAEDKGLVLSLAPFPDPVLAFIDVEAVRKILDNLFQNAIKYGERQVNVSLATTEKEVLITVKNDGPLIPITEEGRIFQPFYRLARHGNHPGTGIGLSLAYSLAELHHGKLLLDTSDLDMNAFVLRLPLFSNAGPELASSATDQAEIAATAMHTPPGPLPRPTILLVEDNLDLLDFVARDLLEDYPVLKATNGEEAMELLKTQPIRLVISDVMMPGIDGFELCRRIKKDLKMSHLPIILLTSRSSLNAEISGLEAGADAYITKPFSMPYLKTRVSNLLENRKHIVNHFSTSPLAHLQSVDHSPVADSFLRALDEVIHANISDPELNVEQLAERLHMSRSTLYRKVKELSGTNPNELINTARLKKAAGLLITKRYRIYEIAGMVGYNSATSFGRNFQKQFGMSPSAYLSSEEAGPSRGPSVTDQLPTSNKLHEKAIISTPDGWPFRHL
jgi:signal transduction histidine kinase/DNA-binding response OmpR family regulator